MQSGKKPASRGSAKKKPASKQPTAKKSSKKPPDPPLPLPSEGSDEDERRLGEVHARIEQGLVEANLSPAQRLEFLDTAKAVLGRMRSGGIRVVHENVKAFKFYPTHAALTAAYKAKYPQARIRNIKGAFDPEGWVHLDGGGVLFGRLATLNEFYAHELTHALDAPGHRISNTKEWRKAWAREIRDTSILGENAAKNEEEGFAEFGQFFLGHPDATRANTRLVMKSCLKVWEGYEL